MKIGIITWFTGSNYGTNLQAIALQYYLRKKGHDVSIVNYVVPQSVENCEEGSFLKRMVSFSKDCIVNLIMKRYENAIHERDIKFRNAIRNNCILTDKIVEESDLINVLNKFDILIFGSDQIWNPNWYNRFYFADYDGISARRISYAPSIGVNSIPQKVSVDIERSVKKIDFLSVRENKAADLLSTFLKKKPEVVVDPTLLLSADDWTKIFPQRKIEDNDYVLAFFLGKEKDHFSAAKRFAKKHKCKYVLIPYKYISYFQNASIYADAGLDEFVNLVRGAKYILTDSFHMTVFSIMHEKQFYTFQRFIEDEHTSQNGRIINLLELTDLMCRYVPYGTSDIKDVDDIEYEKHLEKLNNKIKKSKIFLRNSINA